MTQHNHYVWSEEPVQRGLITRFDWIKAITLPLTREEAEALCVVLSAMRSDSTFVVSIHKPLTVCQPIG